MRLQLLAFSLLVVLCCCEKKSGTATLPGSNVKFTYSTTFDSVISMRDSGTYNFDFTINELTGDIANSKINCSIANLPANMAVYPPSLVVGHTLGGIFQIRTGNVPVGTDTLQFILNDGTLGTVTHKLILHILPPVDYAPKLAGTYAHSYDFCVPNTYNYESVVSTVADTPYEIKISNIRALGGAVILRGWVSTGITIPVQTVSGYTIWGAGTYNLDPLTGNKDYELIINDTMVQGIDTQACTAHIQY